MAAYFEQVLGGTYDNHVLPFLWLKGEARKTITEYLEQIAGADIREVCLESRTHPDFCHDGWWSDLWFIIDECKRLGLKIWLLDDAHFPTGYANGALEGWSCRTRRPDAQMWARRRHRSARGMRRHRPC